MADKVSPEVGKEASPTKNSSGTGPAGADGARPDGKPAAEANGAQKSAASKAVGLRGEMEEREELGAFRFWLRDFVRNTPGWLVSLVFHMIVLLVLAVWMLPTEALDEIRQFVIAPGENEQLDDLEELDDEPFEDVEIDMEAEPVTAESPVEQEIVTSPADDMEAAQVSVELSEFGLERAPRSDLLARVGAFSGKGLSGRGSGARGRLAKRHGGSGGSEKAVAAALKWLAHHQLKDGGWCFNHTIAPDCKGQCRNPGRMAEARNAATALALLPFLGAGQTHKEGKYRPTVRNGLKFLVSRMKLTPQGGSLWEEGGRMYSHGLASIVLSEAYGMTHDRKYHKPTLAALNYIMYAQDPVGGGWRYEAREKGDTSVVGWQLMALKSGRMAYLRVPDTPFRKANVFLNTVQASNGATYGYMDPGKGHATTAIGLLCRMYLGWNKDNPALKRGVEQLSAWGPSTGRADMYYNYYATQVCRHWQGKIWEKWNSVMRDYLVNSQAKEGHETGSWYFHKGDHGAKSGGRLYCTAMATMILEVYYRHMPLYQKQSTEDDFAE